MPLINEKYGQVRIEFDATASGADDIVIIYETDKEEDTILNVETSNFGVEIDQLSGYYYGNNYVDVDNCTFTCYALIGLKELENLTTTYRNSDLLDATGYKPNCANILFGRLQIHPLCLGENDVTNDIVCNNAMCNVTIEGNFKVDNKFNVRLEFKLSADGIEGSEFYDVPFIIGDTSKLKFPEDAEIALDYLENGLLNYDGAEPIGYSTLEVNEDGTFTNDDETLQGQITEDGLWAGIGTYNLIKDSFFIENCNYQDLGNGYYKLIKTSEAGGGHCNFGTSSFQHEIGENNSLKFEWIEGYKYKGTINGEVTLVFISSDLLGSPYYLLNENDEMSFNVINNTGYQGVLASIRTDNPIGTTAIIRIQVEKNKIPTPYVDDTRNIYNLAYESDINFRTDNIFFISKFIGKPNVDVWDRNEYLGVLSSFKDEEDIYAIRNSNRINDFIKNCFENEINTLIFNGKGSNSRLYLNGLDITQIDFRERGTNDYEGIIFNKYHNRNGINAYGPNNYQIQNILCKGELTEYEIEYYSQQRLIDIPILEE